MKKHWLNILGLGFLAACGGGTSTVNPTPTPNPTPTITKISPNSDVAGGAAFTLVINGTNFVAASMANFDDTRSRYGQPRPAAQSWRSPQLPIPGEGAPMQDRRSYGEAGHTITLTNPATPAITLQYDSFKEICDDVSDARVYGGIHFRTDQEAGADLGRAIGRAVYKNNLRRTHDDE